MFIRSRLVIAFGTMLALLVVQLCVVLHFNQRAAYETDVHMTNAMNATQFLSELQVHGQLLRRYEKEYFVYVNDPAGRAKYEKEWTTVYAKMLADLKDAERDKDNMFLPSQESEIRTWRSHAEFYKRKMEDIFHAVPNGKLGAPGQLSPVEVNQMIREGKDRFAITLAGISKVLKEEKAETEAASAAIREAFRVTKTSLLATSIVGILLALYFVLSVPRKVTSPIQQLTQDAERMTKGDLEFSIKDTGSPDFAILVNAIERMRLGQSMLLQRLKRAS